VFAATDLIIRDGLRDGVPPRALNGLLQFVPGDRPPNDPVVIGDLECRRHPKAPSTSFELHEIRTEEGFVVLGTYSLPVPGQSARLVVFAKQNGRWQMADSIEAEGIQFRVWTFRASGSCLLICHRQCADRIEGELSIVRVRSGKLVNVAKNKEPMVDYMVAVNKAGKVVIDYQRFPRALCNSAMGMRMH
jgi:hypothetical protein